MVKQGFTEETANTVLNDGNADLVSSGQMFIANPDLVERLYGRRERYTDYLTTNYSCAIET